MRKSIFVSIILLLLICSCDYISVGPYEVLSGNTFVRSQGSVYDFAITFNSDETCRVIENDGGSVARLDEVYKYTYEYDTFTFEKASGTLVIDGYKTFYFTLTRYSNGLATLILINGAEKFTMEKGTIND